MGGRGATLERGLDDVEDLNGVGVTNEHKGFGSARVGLEVGLGCSA